jgi:hypothetical protein
MTDEPSARQAGFVDGPRVRLADGAEWSLPLREAGRDDPEYDAILAIIAESEDQTEALRGELALTIFLLTRNYDLPADSLDALLRFAPGDPALAVLQQAVHQIARESFERARGAMSSRAGKPHAPAPFRALSDDFSKGRKDEDVPDRGRRR